MKRLRQWSAQILFRKHFGHLVFDFENADTKIEKLNETDKTRYYEAVTAWVESDAYEIEGKGLVMQLYAELATETKENDLITAYRLALLKHKNQDIRLRSQSQAYKNILATRKSFTKFS